MSTDSLYIDIILTGGLKDGCEGRGTGCPYLYFYVDEFQPIGAEPDALRLRKVHVYEAIPYCDKGQMFDTFLNGECIAKAVRYYKYVGIQER